MSDPREHVECIFCGKQNSVPYATAKSRYDERWFEVVRCRACDLVYTNPRIANKAAEIENRPPNPGLFAEDSRMQKKRSAAQLQLRRIERYCAGGRLLDFGCGPGILVHEALKRGWDAYGVELDRNLVLTANRHFGDTRLWHDYLDALVPVHRGRFDAIISTQVFEHLSNPLAMLIDLRALLRPGGIILIDVPNLRCIAERRRRGDSLDPTAHLYYFTQPTLIRLLERAGFAVLGSSAAPNNLTLYWSLVGRLGLGGAAVGLAALTERIPLPGIGKGVFAVGRLEPGRVPPPHFTSSAPRSSSS